MARQKQVTHYYCEHENTAKERQVCRDARRHSECSHPKTEWYGKLCDKERAREKE